MTLEDPLRTVFQDGSSVSSLDSDPHSRFSRSPVRLQNYKSEFKRIDFIDLANLYFDFSGVKSHDRSSLAHLYLCASHYKERRSALRFELALLRCPLLFFNSEPG